MAPQSLTADPTLAPPELPASILAERAENYPIGAGLDMDALEDGSSSEIWHRLRADEPVTWCPALEGWLVTSRAMTAEMYRSPERFTVFSSVNLIRSVLDEQMLVSDGERHERQRKPFEPPFKARPVHENYETLVQRQVDQAIDEIRDRETLDLGAWASKFAVSTIGEVLGLGEKRPEELRDMYSAFAAGMDYGAADLEERLELAAKAKARFAELLTEDLRRVREQPDDSIISHMAEESGALDDDEIIGNVRLILFGGIETVESMISSTLWLLLNDAESLAEIRADRSLTKNAVEESLRLIPPVGFTDRWAVSDMDFHGAEVLAGEMILPVIIAANRDPEAFADPDEFDVRRENARAHYSLSHGKHFCLGANLARLEGDRVLNGFLDAFPEMTLAEGTGGPSGFVFRRAAPVYLSLRS